MPEDDAPRDATLLAFDYGTRRIGLAVGERRLGHARPLDVVANVNGTPDWAALDARVAEWRPHAFVIGWPLDASGAEQAMNAHVRGFVKRLVRRYGCPVHVVDERYSSVAAAERLSESRRDGRRARRTTHADVDTHAAALILEDWFETETDPFVAEPLPARGEPNT